MHALRDVSLDIPEMGVGIVGPNGAGKSTLLRLICGIARPTKGTVETIGYNPWDCREELLSQMGVLFDQQGYPSWKTGEEYLRLISEVKGVEKQQEDVEHSSAAVGISEALKRPIRTYSAGMKQRLGIAAAMLGDPSVLVLDEPMSSLDPMWRLSYIRELKERKKSLRGLILSSHFSRDIEQLCDYLVVVNGGEIPTVRHLPIPLGSDELHIYSVQVEPLEDFLESLESVSGIEEVIASPETSVVEIHGKSGLEGDLSQILRAHSFILHEFTSRRPSLEEYLANVLSQVR
ncbi:MAG: ABC transporter ATP-binding protein [Thermoplasmata archaeon]